MSKQTTYIKEFNEYDSAFDWMKMKNQACERAGNKNDWFCVVPGPDENFAVVDSWTAIDLQLGYVWAFRGWIENPWKS